MKDEMKCGGGGGGMVLLLLVLVCSWGWAPATRFSDLVFCLPLNTILERRRGLAAISTEGVFFISRRLQLRMMY